MMFKIKSNVIGFLNGVVPFINDKLLLQGGNAPVFMPFYHTVEDIAPDYISSLYQPKTKKEFIAEIDYILKYFDAVDVSTVLNAEDQKSQKPIVHFSFDDGLRSCREVIAPILKEKGVPATFFVNNEFVEGKKSFYRFEVARLINHLRTSKNIDEQRATQQILEDEKRWKGDLFNSINHLQYSDYEVILKLKDVAGVASINEERIFMNKGEIQSLVQEGFNVGAHSADHPLYSSLSVEGQKDQTKRSVEFVQQNFKPKEKLFAFPFTDDGVSIETIKWMFEELNLDAVFGTAGLKYGYMKHHFQRVPMEMYSGKPHQRVKSEFLYYKLMKLMGKTKAPKV